MSAQKKYEIGEIIRKLREEKGMSQEDLAEKVGYGSRSSINKIEMGKNDIPRKKIDAFAKALDVPVTVIMGLGMPILNDNCTEIIPIPNILKVRTPLPHVPARKNEAELVKIATELTDEKLFQLLEFAKFLSKED